MWGNVEQNNSEYGHFLRSVCCQLMQYSAFAFQANTTIWTIFWIAKIQVQPGKLTLDLISDCITFQHALNLKEGQKKRPWK